jgi:hypothetical protein
VEHTLATCTKICLLLAMDAARSSSDGRCKERQSEVGHPPTSSTRGIESGTPRPAAGSTTGTQAAPRGEQQSTCLATCRGEQGRHSSNSIGVCGSRWCHGGELCAEAGPAQSIQLVPKLRGAPAPCISLPGVGSRPARCTVPAVGRCGGG